jgi:hypothetical protein
VNDLTVREAVADAAIEIDAFREGRAERAGCMLSNLRNGITAPPNASCELLVLEWAV